MQNDVTTNQPVRNNNAIALGNRQYLDASNVLGPAADLIRSNQITAPVNFVPQGNCTAHFIYEVFNDVSRNCGWNYDGDSGNSNFVDPLTQIVKLRRNVTAPDNANDYINVRAIFSVNSSNGCYEARRLCFLDGSGSFPGGTVLVDSVSGGDSSMTVPVAGWTTKSNTTISAPYPGAQAVISQDP